MEPPDPPELGPALLRWLQTFDFASTVRSWKDTQDGQILWRVLVDVEPSYFLGDLPESGDALNNWIPRWQNLKHINRLVWSFIRDDCGKLQELSNRMNPDLKAIASDASARDSVELTKAVLLAALYSPESNQRMIQVLDRLGTKTGIAIAQCISSMEHADTKLVEAAAARQTDTESDFEQSPEPRMTEMRGGSTKGSSSGGQRDQTLEHEERLIKAYTRIKQLEDSGAGLTEELEQSRSVSKTLEKDVKSLQDQLQHDQPSQIEDGALETMRQRSLQDRDNITQLEVELADARAEVESQEKQLDRLSRQSEAYHKLQEEVEGVRAESDELKQQAKANENLRRKIQALQSSGDELERAQQELKTLRPLRQRVAALQQTNEENRKTIQNGEQEIFDQRTTRRRLEHEMRMLTQQIEGHQHDLDLMRAQAERSRRPNGSSEGIEVAEQSTLDDEFATREKPYRDLEANDVQLEGEISKLRQAQSEEEDPAVEPKANEHLKARCELLEKQYLEVYQENLGLASASIDAEISIPFIQLRGKLEAESKQRSAIEKQFFDVNAELFQTKLKLSSADARYAAVGKEEDEAIAGLQQAASVDNEILHTENTRLLEHLRTSQRDLDEHRSLLKHALLDNGALLKLGKDARLEQELKYITEQLWAVVDDTGRIDGVASKLTQRIEESRNLTAQVADERQSHADVVSALEAKVKHAEEATKTTKSPEDEHLQRELDLMTSAWYDLTRRMQSDAVVVQRRADAPKSFLNRQRKLLNTMAMPPRR